MGVRWDVAGILNADPAPAAWHAAERTPTR